MKSYDDVSKGCKMTGNFTSNTGNPTYNFETRHDALSEGTVKSRTCYEKGQATAIWVPSISWTQSTSQGQATAIEFYRGGRLRHCAVCSKV